ncbi:MAG: GEVED domain-containing protein [Bacteroidota bacterium]
MKKIYLSVLIALIGLPAIAQRKCATMESNAAQLQRDPSIEGRRARIEQHTFEYENSGAPLMKAGTVVNIPVVVHVLYRTSAQNISDAQIQSQITVLNNDFRKLNADRTNVPSTFSALAADAEITFCLATVDASGNATTGITRTSTTKTAYDASLDDAKFTSQGGKDAWNTTKYLNLWIVPDIKDGADYGILGYAQFPGGTASTDGVVIAHDKFGTTGTAVAPFNKGRTATHEVGHWLNLRHIWGDASCGSDLVSDTPTHGDKNFGCPSHPKANSCGTTAEMFMNYMDYTDDACMYMFSTGQKNRMQALFASGGFRYGITTSTACGGTVTPPTPSYCAANGTNVSYEYIKNVTLNTINNTTAANGGYGNFTSLSTTVNKGAAYTLSLTPGFVGTAYSEYFKVYIDYNNDLDFVDAGELVYTSAGTTAAVSTSITIPSTAATGAVRMRVIMKDGAIATPCEVYTYGEVEDYTINIQAGTTPSCGLSSGLSASAITTTGATLNWTAVTGALSYNVNYKTSAATVWTSTTATTNSKAITGLTAGTAYVFQVQTVCSGASSAFTASANFTTTAPTTTSTCATPVTNATASITSTGANVSWSNTGASSYTLRYKAVSSTTWITVAASASVSQIIYQLAPATNYEWQVMATCTGSTSAYSASRTFTTLGSTTCGTDIYEANETLAAAKSISTGTTIKALICGSTDADWYKISNSSTYPHIKVALSTLAADYDLYLYSAAGALLYKSENGTTTAEKVIYNSAPVGTYYIKVSGYNGANNATTYYSLLPTRSSTAYASRLADDEIVPKDDVISTTNLLEGMMVYPNPSVDNVINVAIPTAVTTTTKITLFDAMGRIVKTVEVEPASVNTITTDEFSSGIYILRAETQNGVEMRKVQVIK